VARGNVPVDEGDYITDAFTREASAFIRENKGAPFFLYLPYNAPHGPLQVTQKYYDRFPKIENEAKRIYAAMISALDDSIGAVLGVIEERGLEDNTLVILISDNGGGVAAHANNSPLRLGKHTLFEGGVRVPFVMKWPGHISAGGTYEHPVSTLDVFPTVVAAARSTKILTKELDGVDLTPILQNGDNPPPHQALFWRNGANWAVREGDWKLIYAAERHWLYDLSSDVGEKHNIASAHPDIIERLTTQYKEWNKGNIEPSWPPLAVKGQPRFAVDGVNIKWAL
jgi:arylsulfatase A-like enzyme